jgi:hypothetical protein
LGFTENSNPRILWVEKSTYDVISKLKDEFLHNSAHSPEEFIT